MESWSAETHGSSTIAGVSRKIAEYNNFTGCFNGFKFNIVLLHRLIAKAGELGLPYYLTHSWIHNFPKRICYLYKWECNSLWTLLTDLLPHCTPMTCAFINKNKHMYRNIHKHLSGMKFWNEKNLTIKLINCLWHYIASQHTFKYLVICWFYLRAERFIYSPSILFNTNNHCSKTDVTNCLFLFVGAKQNGEINYKTLCF